MKTPGRPIERHAWAACGSDVPLTVSDFDNSLSLSLCVCVCVCGGELRRSMPSVSGMQHQVAVNLRCV